MKMQTKTTTKGLWKKVLKDVILHVNLALELLLTDADIGEVTILFLDTLNILIFFHILNILNKAEAVEVRDTPQRYLFYRSTRYYTIFWDLIRLSHDISDIL